MVDFSKVKLIVWDLDDTLWNGTLSEGSINFPKSHQKLISDLVDCGIVNSICSKNNKEDVDKVLKQYSLSEYFVFNSINWEPKGRRIATMVKNMSLRYPNVLFIDDNISNLKETEFYCDGIMTATPDVISALIDYINKLPQKDIGNKRLKQYKVLEEKFNVSLQFSSNEEFLKDCNIKVVFCDDCLNQIDRLYELVQRTNQLNFTKLRPSKECFEDSLLKSDKAGYIKVKDRFGDYGIVGFYQITDNKFDHFLFSCRTIGQGIEQFVYAKLSFPVLNIVGDVAVKLDNSIPDWIELVSINEFNSFERMDKVDLESKVLFKGPCDMSGMVGYLQLDDTMTTEFTFMNSNNHSVETHNHSAHIFNLGSLSSDEISNLCNSVFFLEYDNFKSTIFDEKYDVVFLSTLIEGIYGKYKSKSTGEIVAFGHYDFPLTDKKYWDRYINNEIQTYGYKITESDLENFSKDWIYIGRTTPDEYIAFLEFLLKKMPSTTICLILGSEIPYEKERESTFLDRHVFHKNLNNAIREFSKVKDRIKYIDINNHIKSQSDFTNNINHFTPKVYYSLSKEMSVLLNSLSGNTSNPSQIRYLVKQYIQPILIKILPSKLFVTMKQIFLSRIMK